MSRLDEVTEVVLAPNPSPMTLDGTNTYLVGAAGQDAVMVVDPGPDLPAHRTAVDRALGRRHVSAVVLTHHHGDHAQAAGWAGAWGAPLLAFSPALIAPEHVAALRDGQQLAVAGVHVEVVHTPGHCSDHVCLRIAETGVVLCGDHILGRGSTVVAWPDGDMTAYLGSLRRLAELQATALYPGHGPPLLEPAAVIATYLAHREERERQILDALRAGDDSPAAIVTRVYADVDAALHPAAERSVRAHLDRLVGEGLARRVRGRWLA